MKLSHKIFSILVTTFFLSFLAQASESNSTNVNALVSSSDTRSAVTHSTQRASQDQAMPTSGRTYVAQGGGGGAFPPDPALASTSEESRFCVAGFCFTIIWP